MKQMRTDHGPGIGPTATTIWVMLVLVLALIFPTAAQAQICPCANKKQTPAQAFEEAELVMLGVVHWMGEFEGSQEALFMPIVTWKGPADSQFVFTVGTEACDWFFYRDGVYLVYGFEAKPGVFRTSLCTRTDLMDNREQDLDFLDDITPVRDNRDCVVPERIKREAVCPALYQPVCGCDGRTYANDCMARRFGLKSWRAGACE